MTENKMTYTGSTQEQRYLEPMVSGYVKPDELTLEDLLVFASGFSYLIKYFNFENEHQGYWEKFWLDETIVLSEILKSTPELLDDNFKTTIEKAVLFRRTQKKLKYLRLAVQKIFETVELFEYWLEKLLQVEKTTHTELKSREELDSIFTSTLNTEVSRLIAVDEAIANIAQNDEIYKKYNANRLKYYIIEPIDITELISEDKEKAELPDCIELLEKLFGRFYQIFFFLQKKAADFLKQSLQRNNHLPHIGLYLTFLKLYKIPQENINSFNQKFIDYYYTNTLQQKTNPPHPDSVYLIANLVENAQNVKIKKGDRFVAGEDSEGNSIIYKANTALQLNNIKIDKLITYHISRGALSIKGVPHPFVTNIYHSLLPDNVFSQEKNEILHPVFGTDQSKLSTHERTMDEAEIGFAFSSKNLFLEGGERDIDIQFIFDPESFKNLIEHVENFSIAAQKLRSEIIDTAFIDAFELLLTATEGWYKIKKYSVFIEEKIHALKFRFTIPHTEPAIVAYDQEIHGGKYAAVFPVFKCRLTSKSFIYAYSLLQKLVLQRINIDVDVKNFKSLQIYNHNGELDIQSVFQPFTSTPKKGNYFVIGSKEVFRKELKDLKINIRWFELPAEYNRFDDYYDTYKLGITNSSFKTRLSILDQGKWKPKYPDEQQEFCLFSEDTDGQGILSEENTIKNIDISRIWRSFDDIEKQEELDFNHKAESGFIKLELSAPEFAFGHDTYPALLTLSYAKKSKGFNLTLTNDKGKGKEPPRFNPPYTPQIENLNIDYSASSSILFSDVAIAENIKSTNVEQFYHVYPYGEVLEYPNVSVRQVNMLPEFDFEGCLLIGLSNVEAPQTISFLFEMVETSADSSDQEKPLIEWEYLVNNRWETLNPSKIYMDETQDFRQTGIIMLEVPIGIENKNTQLDPELYWLRAKAINNTQITANIKNVYTQVFTATFDQTQEVTPENNGRVLPPETIERPAGTITGIISVTQPLQSVDGEKAEIQKSFYERISERLNHRNRAVTLNNLEKIILGHFKQIFQVTCFPNMTNTGRVKPGNVLIVVAPYKEYSLDENKPQVGNKYLVQIKKYLQEIASPFVKIEIRNPVYEHIKIISTVKFKPGYSQGFYIQELNNDLYGFLSGNIREGQNKITLGGSIHIADVLSFMRTLYYIDTVGTLSLVQVAIDFRGRHVLIDTARLGNENDTLNATKPWAVLVPFKEHEITSIGKDDADKAQQSGIGQLRVDREFIID